MIEFRGAARRFGRGTRAVDALSEVTLLVPRGTVTAVVGPNGAGKSTLFALTLGFLAPTSGEVTIDGSDPRGWVRARGAGFLPDRFDLPRDWPVRRTLEALARLEMRAAASAADRALDRFGLVDVAERAAGTLSRGTLQRVGLAQAWLAEHTLVVLDEPTQGLDPLWRIRLRDEVAALRDAGCTVLLASHDLAEVERLADHVVLLDGGRIRDTLQPSAGEADVGQWRLTLARPSDRVGDVFPDSSVEDGRVYVVRAHDAAELSARLAALLDLGIDLIALEPITDGLESRVRKALEGHD